MALDLFSAVKGSLFHGDAINIDNLVTFNIEYIDNIEYIHKIDNIDNIEYIDNIDNIDNIDKLIIW